MSQPFKESEKQKDPTAEIGTTRTVVRSRPFMPPQSMGAHFFLGSSERKLPLQMVIKPTLLGLDQRKGTHKINHMGPYNKILPRRCLMNQMVLALLQILTYLLLINKVVA